MGKNKKNGKKRKNCKGKKTNINQKKGLKILNGVDLSNDYLDKTKEKKLKDSDNFNLNDHIQTFVSIFLTAIVVIALIILVLVIYNNYRSKNNLKNYDVLEVCKDYIKKDYKIKENDVEEYLKNVRGIIYNINNFKLENINNEDYLNFATYFIWNSNLEYEECDKKADENCLVTKKEMSLNALKGYFKKYLNIKNFNIVFSDKIENEEIRIYQKDDKVVLTFGEFEYQTAKHDIIDIKIDEDIVEVIFVLNNKNSDESYSYIGYKKVNLKYVDKRFIIEKIETNLI